MEEQKEKVMTVEDVINITIGILQPIQVPISVMESVGLPIYRAVNNLKECSRVLAAERERTETPEVSVQPIPADEVPEEIRRAAEANDA